MPEITDGLVAPEMMEHLRDMVHGRTVTVPDDRMPENGEPVTAEAYPEIRPIETNATGGPITRAMLEQLTQDNDRTYAFEVQPRRPRFEEYVQDMVPITFRHEGRPTDVRENRLGHELPGEDGVTRNRHGDPIVEVDLAGATLDQRTLDYAYREVLKAATNMEPGVSVELRIKRFAVSRMPRLIADTGVIYELLVKMIDEREEAAGQAD